MKKIEEIFATEGIAKAIIMLGFNEQCVGKHAGFKQFNEADDQMKDKYVHVTDIHGAWTEIQQQKRTPFFTICPAPTWDQLINWFREEHDIDVEVLRIRKQNLFEYSVWDEGKLASSNRIETRQEALEKAMILAIHIVVERKKKAIQKANGEEEKTE